MAVIATLNSNCGSGKTTWATNLTGEVDWRKLKPLLVDSGPLGCKIDRGYIREQQKGPLWMSWDSIETLRRRDRHYHRAILNGSAGPEQLTVAVQTECH